MRLYGNWNCRRQTKKNKLYNDAWHAKEATKKARASNELIAGHLKSAPEKIFELQETVGELKDNLLTAIRTPQMVTVRTKEKGRPYTLDFEAHTRNLLATGMSANPCRQAIL